MTAMSINSSSPQGLLPQGFQSIGSVGEGRVGCMTAFRRVAGYAMDFFTPSSSPCSIVGLKDIGRILSECSCERERVYQAAKTVLIGSSLLGAGGTVIACVAGIPGAAVWTGFLTATSFAGVIVTDQAARDYAYDKRMDEMDSRNQELARQATNLAAQNETLTTNVDRLTANVTRLSSQVTDLQEIMTQFAFQNDNSRTIVEQFRAYVEQCAAEKKLDRLAIVDFL